MPSIIASDVAVIVIPEPPNTIGSKELLLVKPNVVVPAKVTVVPALTLDRSILLSEGAYTLLKVISVDDATQGAICEYTVAVHAVWALQRPAKARAKSPKICEVLCMMGDSQARWMEVELGRSS